MVYEYHSRYVLGTSTNSDEMPEANGGRPPIIHAHGPTRYGICLRCDYGQDWVFDPNLNSKNVAEFVDVPSTYLLWYSYTTS